MATSAAAEPAKPAVDLHALGARVVSVFGAFQSSCLIMMPANKAATLFPAGALGAAAPSFLLDAVERDLVALRKRDPDLANSAIAASALAMALEVEHPFNSATSKSMCQARLTDALLKLRELAPPEEPKDAVNKIQERNARRRARVARTANTKGS